MPAGGIASIFWSVPLRVPLRLPAIVMAQEDAVSFE
jgi:hypothetical protein